MSINKIELKRKIRRENLDNPLYTKILNFLEKYPNKAFSVKEIEKEIDHTKNFAQKFGLESQLEKSLCWMAFHLKIIDGFYYRKMQFFSAKE